MNYRDFHGDSNSMAVYFIIDQSRNEPPYRRATLMMDACAFFADESAKEARGELYALATECFDCDQDAQRLIGSLRAANAKSIAASPAIEFLLAKLESADFRTKLDFIENAGGIGLGSGESVLTQTATRIAAFEQRLELFLFRVRTHHWRTSNAETIAREQSAPASIAA